MSSEWTPDVLDPENDQTREVYANAGLALYTAQVLEHGLVNLVLVARAGSPKLRSQEDYDRVFEELVSMTMGQQLRQALAVVEFSEEQVAALERALERRNFLVHDFFRVRIGRFLTASGRNRLIAELEEIRDTFSTIEREVDSMTMAYYERHGLSRQMFEAEVEKLKDDERVRGLMEDALDAFVAQHWPDATG
jgi:hypothetical protein